MQNKISQRLIRSTRRGVLLAAVAVMLLALAGLRPAAPALASCGGVTNVATAQQLIDAIEAYNDVGGPCDFTIRLTDDIRMTDNDGLYLSNIGLDVTLTLDGDFHTVDFDGLGGGILIHVNGKVFIQDITLLESYYNGIEIQHGFLHVLRSTVTESHDQGIDVEGGTVVIEESAIIDNGYHGINVDFEYSRPHVWVINSTIAHNSGAGLNSWNSDVEMTHTTVVDNSYGVYAGGDSAGTIHNSILAGTYADCLLGEDATLAIKYSLVQTNGDTGDFLCVVTNGLSGNVVGDDPRLSTLGDYGGPTVSMPPAVYTGSLSLPSPAIDSGDNTLAVDEEDNPLSTDQRGAGFPRVDNSVVDMGAVEGSIEVACAATMTVDTDLEMANAIRCFNLSTTGGDYTIAFGADITLTIPLPTISNSTDGIRLLIDGAFHILDGDDEFYTLDILNTPDVAIDRLTIARSDENGVLAENSDVRISRSTITKSEWHGIEFDDGNLTIVDSTISDNDERGIEFDSDNDTDEFYLINSTLFGNGFLGEYEAISVEGGITTIINSTIYRNFIGLEAYRTDLTVNNTILAGSEEYDCTAEDSSESFNSSLIQFNAQSYSCNLVVGGNILGADPLLAIPGDYGGPTHTAPPLQFTGGLSATSLAVDAGDDGLAEDENGTPLETDQRGDGFDRVEGDYVDIGAVEALEVNCAPFPRTVGNEAQLYNAFLCYRGVTNPGVATINLSGNVELSATTYPIENPNTGVSLVINGSGFAIDGNNVPGTRPLTILPDTIVTLNDAVITGGNIADYGGGIFNEGDLTVNSSRVENNITSENGGGIFNEIGATLTVYDTIITSNLAAFPDGDGGGINNAGYATLSHTTISGNLAEGDNFSLGGGILNEGTMILTRSMVIANALDVETDYGFGGGIANQANLVIRDTVISGNSITVGGYGAFGGGVYSDADEYEDVLEEHGARLLIINSTISGNGIQGEDGSYGGGLSAYDCCWNEPVEVTLINTTVVENMAVADVDSFGGGAYFQENFWGGLEVTIHNSILAGNTTGGAVGGDCVLSDSEELRSTFESLHSLYQDTNEGACELGAANPDGDGNIVGQPANLGPLANNGGETLTHMPNAGSPAIDSGDNDLALDEGGNPLTADQRGFTPRVVNGTVDMGAVELDAEGPAGDPAIYMTAAKPGQINGGGPAFGTDDILMWDGAAWTTFFDGSAALLTPKKAKHNISAFWIGDGDELIMSFAQNRRNVPGVSVPVDGMDLVRWDDVDGFSFFFDGSDVDLTKKTAEKIDALHVLPGSASPINDGNCVAYLLISTQGPGKVQQFGGGSLKFGGEDILGFCATQLGFDTAGHWHLALDGSAVGLPKNATDSISLSADGSTLYLTTSKAVNLGGGVVGGHSMVYAFDWNTGPFSGPLFKAAENGLNQKVNGLQMN